MLNKNDPLIGAVQEVMKQNQAHRDAINAVNEKFGVQDRRALPHEKQGEWDNEYKKTISEGLHTLKEEAKPLDELSKGKLGSYIKAASHDVATKSAATRGFARDADDKRKSGDFMGSRKSSEKSDRTFQKSWKRREGIAKAVDKLAKEDYDSREAGKAAKNKELGKMTKKISRHMTDPEAKTAWKNMTAKFKAKADKQEKKAVTGMDEAKSAPDRVVTASKKAEKGAKWRLQARNMDRDGSEMELRQGKRVKMTGVFDRHAQDFQMTPAKKNKTDWKAKSKYYDDPKDILKTVKESSKAKVPTNNE